MHDLEMLFSNKVLGVALLGWFFAQSLKVIIVLIVTRRLDLARMFGAGGMPSSHASTVVSLSMAIGFSQGFETGVFALSAVFALVVMYDAAGVRRAAGKQARLLNRIVHELIEERRKPDYEVLKELLGHTPVEVISGAVLGAMTAAIFM